MNKLTAGVAVVVLTMGLAGVAAAFDSGFYWPRPIESENSTEYTMGQPDLWQVRGPVETGALADGSKTPQGSMNASGPKAGDTSSHVGFDSGFYWPRAIEEGP